MRLFAIVTKHDIPDASPLPLRVLLDVWVMGSHFSIFPPRADHRATCTGTDVRDLAGQASFTSQRLGCYRSRDRSKWATGRGDPGTEDPMIETPWSSWVESLHLLRDQTTVPAALANATTLMGARSRWSQYLARSTV